MDLDANKENMTANSSQGNNADEAVVVSASPDASQTTINANSNKINLISISDRGFTNGVLDLPQEPFAEWLEAGEEIRYNEDQLFECQRKLAETEDILGRSLSSWKDYYQETTNELDKIAENEEKRNYLEDEVKRKDAEVVDKKNKLSQLVFLYSWVPAVLLCLAGLVFIGADVGITHDIVVNALNQPDGVESWLFAFALAFVAFVFKPAFDRILEKNYKDEKVKKRNHIFLVVVAGFALVTLTIMGFFRGETDAERNQMKEMRAERTTLQDQVDNSSDESQKALWNQEIKNINGEIKSKQNNIIGNGWRLWIFILSSILFAVSGTICISIGIASSEVLIQKYRLEKGIQSLLKAREGLKLEIKDVLSAMKISKNAMDKLEKQISLDPGLEQLREQISTYQTNIFKFKQQLLEHSIRKDRASYTDAYNRGQKYSLDGALTIKMSELEDKSESSRSNYGIPKERKTQNKGTGSRRRRPFVMLRRIIADQYSKSGHPNTMDTEIEVSDVI